MFGFFIEIDQLAAMGWFVGSGPSPPCTSNTSALIRPGWYPSGFT